MKKTKWIPAIGLGVLAAWLVREPFTRLLFAHKNFAGRSPLIQLALLAAYTALFSALLLLLFPKPMKRLAEKWERRTLPAASNTAASCRLTSLNLLDTFLAALLGLSSLVLYVRTLAPGIQYADSGEFQTLVYSLGNTHPTGYPIYIILGRLFTLLPIADLAMRVNLFNACFGALTVSLIYLIVRILAGRRLAALTAALLMAVSPLFWFYAVFAESYAPSSAFMGGVILSVLLWRLKGQRHWLAVGGLLGGLSLGVHVSTALIAPGVLLYLLVSIQKPHNEGRAQRGHSEWAAAILGVLMGILLVIAAFLVLDANNAKADYFHAVVKPNISVFNLEVEDLDSPFERLFFLFSARQFRHAMFDDPATIWPVRIHSFSDMTRAFFSPLMLALMWVGMAGLLVQKWREGLLLLIGWAVSVFFMLNYNISVGDVLVFFFPIIIYVWLGMGVSTLMGAFSEVARCFFTDRQAVLASDLLGLILLAGTMHPYRHNIAEAWNERAVTFMSGSEFAAYAYPINHPEVVRDEAKKLVDAVEDDAVVFLGWNLLFPSYFVAHIEEGRTAMDFHEAILRHRDTADIYESTAEYVREVVAYRPVYYYGECPRSLLLDQFSVKQYNRNGVELCQVVGLRN